MLKIIGAGLSRTGTQSLHAALGALGFASLHDDVRRMRDVLDGSQRDPDFRRYDDLDAVTGLPAAEFYAEFARAYPESRVVLTVRPVDAWWRSVAHHFNAVEPIAAEARPLQRLAKTLGLSIGREPESDEVERTLRVMAFGSPVATEFLYKKRYRDHNARVIATVPADRLLVMDLTAGDGWAKLCGFLRVNAPGAPFPHEMRGTPAPRGTVQRAG